MFNAVMDGSEMGYGFANGNSGFGIYIWIIFLTLFKSEIHNPKSKIRY